MSDFRLIIEELSSLLSDSNVLGSHLAVGTVDGFRDTLTFKVLFDCDVQHAIVVILECDSEAFNLVGRSWVDFHHKAGDLFVLLAVSTITLVHWDLNFSLVIIACDVVLPQ